MNVERILALADLIEKQPHAGHSDESGFRMSRFTHLCGTPACIAGWAEWSRDGENSDKPWVTFRSGMNYLEITVAQASALFEPTHMVWPDITPAQAATTLRKLAETGKVDWSHVETEN